jgi:hypothetical protein
VREEMGEGALDDFLGEELGEGEGAGRRRPSSGEAERRSALTEVNRRGEGGDLCAEVDWGGEAEREGVLAASSSSSLSDRELEEDEDELSSAATSFFACLSL